MEIPLFCKENWKRERRICVGSSAQEPRKDAVFTTRITPCPTFVVFVLGILSEGPIGD